MNRPLPRRWRALENPSRRLAPARTPRSFEQDSRHETRDSFEQNPKAPSKTIHGNALVIAVVHAREIQLLARIPTDGGEAVALGAEARVRLRVGEARDHVRDGDSERIVLAE